MPFFLQLLPCRPGTGRCSRFTCNFFLGLAPFGWLEVLSPSSKPLNPTGFCIGGSGLRALAWRGFRASGLGFRVSGSGFRIKSVETTKNRAQEKS